MVIFNVVAFMSVDFNLHKGTINLLYERRRREALPYSFSLFR